MARFFNQADAAAVAGLAAQLEPLKFQPEPDLAFFTAGDARASALAAYTRLYPIDPSHCRARALGYVDLAGQRLAVHYFLPNTPQGPRGTLVLVHGLYDHLGLYQDAVALGLAAGYSVVGFDLPGHGLSEGARACIQDFAIYSDALADLITRLNAHADLFREPLVALGQSTGGAILLDTLWRHPATAARFTRQVLMAPLVVPRGWRFGRILHRVLHPWVKQLKRGLSSSSHNPERLAFINHQDPLQAHILSLDWLAAMQRYHLELLRRPPVETPVLVVQGTADTTLNWRYNLRVLRAKLPGVQVELIEGADHQLLNERDDYRGAALAAAGKFLFDEDDANLATSSPNSSL